MNVNYDMFDLQTSYEIRDLEPVTLVDVDAIDADYIDHSLGHPFDYAFDIDLIDDVTDDEVADDDDGGALRPAVCQILHLQMRVCEIVSVDEVRKINR